MFPKGMRVVDRTLLCAVRYYRRTPSCELNRIFADKSELHTTSEDADVQMISLHSTDYRFQHLVNILKIGVGDHIKMGVIDGGITDRARITVKTEERMTMNIGKSTDLSLTPKPHIDLILAFPRPARLTWLFPVISSLGVGRISLIRAAKTEKGYMGK